jgi:hypothetical protein
MAKLKWKICLLLGMSESGFGGTWEEGGVESCGI